MNGACVFRSEGVARPGAGNRGDPVMTWRPKRIFPVGEADRSGRVESHHAIWAEACKQRVAFCGTHAESGPIAIRAVRIGLASPTDRVLRAIVHDPVGTGTPLHRRDRRDTRWRGRERGSGSKGARFARRLTAPGRAGLLETNNPRLERCARLPPSFPHPLLGHHK